MNNPPLIDKVALIKIQDKKILVTLSKGKDAWYMPGGKREGQETDVETLTREIQEELGVNIDPTSVQHYHTFEAPAHGQPAGTLVRMTCYQATYTGRPSAQAELADIAWFSYADRPRMGQAGQIIFDHLQAHNLLD